MRRAPCLVKATMEGVVRAPSEFSITRAWPNVRSSVCDLSLFHSNRVIFYYFTCRSSVGDGHRALVVSTRQFSIPDSSVTLTCSLGLSDTSHHVRMTTAAFFWFHAEQHLTSWPTVCFFVVPSKSLLIFTPTERNFAC